MMNAEMNSFINRLISFTERDDKLERIVMPWSELFVAAREIQQERFMQKVKPNVYQRKREKQQSKTKWTVQKTEVVQLSKVVG